MRARQWLSQNLALLFSLSFLTFAQAEVATSSLHIVATNYPLAYFAERLGGAEIGVTLPVPPGVDPAFWRPSIADVSVMQSADLVILNGANYEQWLPTVSLPRNRLIDTSAQFKDQLIVIESGVAHSHGGVQHTHTGTAFTTWLDFRLAGAQVTALGNAIARKRPAWRAALAHRESALLADLGQLDQELETLARMIGPLPIIASHPVYQYLAQRYGLKLTSVHWEPDAMPAPEEWTAFEQLLKQHPAKLMLWEASPKDTIITKLSGMGIRVIVFDPCANRPKHGDFITAMRKNIVELRSGYAASK